MSTFPRFGLLVLCVLANFAEALTFEEAVALAEAQSSEDNSARSDYLNRRMEYENEIALDEQGGCYFISGGGITQVIRINEHGVVDLVLSNIESPKSECFRKLYLGTKFDPPPLAPIYQKMLMGYGLSPP